MFYLTVTMIQILNTLQTVARYHEIGDLLDVLKEWPGTHEEAVLIETALAPLTAEGLIRTCNRPGQDTWYVITPKGTEHIHREWADEEAADFDSEQVWNHGY